MGNQFSISALLNLCSESVGASNFEILAEDSDTSSPSPITVRMEYLFALQFWYCKLCAKKNDDGEAESIALLIFALIVGRRGVVSWGRKSYLGSF